MPTIGRAAPQFTLDAHDGSRVSLSDFRGRTVVLYFYPADDTPTCTKEACEFRDAFPAVDASSAVILGVSPDSVESHAKFRKKHKLPFTLLSDPDHAVAERYGAWGKKKLFGVSYMGIVRTTFIIDAGGKLTDILPVPRLKGHVEDVVERSKRQQKAESKRESR